MAVSKDDIKFLRQCEEIKHRSYDPHRQVSAIIVSSDGSVIAEGVNAPPRQLGITLTQAEEEIRTDSSWKYYMLEHAERNAIFSARDDRISIIGSTMYGTLFPCADCARAIVAAQIIRFVCLMAETDVDRDVKWAIHHGYARRIFEMGGVNIQLVARSLILL